MNELRKATGADIPRIVELGKMMHAESQYSHNAFSGLQVAATMATLIAQHCVLVQIRDGIIVGGIAGYTSPAWYGPTLMAMELSTFIHPEHRGGALARKLVRAFVSWAKSRGVAPGDIQIGCVSGIHQETTEKLYTRLGGRRLGVLFAFGG